MKKTVLITGATDGIGLAAAKMLVAEGHRVLIHGRNPQKLEAAKQTLLDVNSDAEVETYIADLSVLSEIKPFADKVKSEHDSLDALINNAGVYTTNNARTKDGFDVRFAVNTLAPYLLTKALLPLLQSGRVVNLSSAAQAPVETEALRGNSALGDGMAYAQSKLAITIWSQEMAKELGNQGPVIIAVNPASMLGSKMVKDAYGVAGGDINIGADILRRAALDEEFADASGKYFDNDIGRFAAPHPQAANSGKVAEVMQVIDELVSGF